MSESMSDLRYKFWGGSDQEYTILSGWIAQGKSANDIGFGFTPEPEIPSPSGGLTVDVNTRDAVDSILLLLRAQGLME